MSSAALPGLPPPRPIPLKDRSSIIFIEKGNVDVLDGAFVVVDKNGIRTHIPIGGLACLMLEPGARISHAAVALEARLALDEDARLKVVRKMYAMRFGEAPPERRSVDQLRGIEGVRVRKLYELIAGRHGVEWKRRDYDARDFGTGDIPNRCLSAATSCLYGLAEAAVLAAGYAPAIGFLHTGKPLSFVYDVADVFKFETVVPEAFRIAGQAAHGQLKESAEGAVRRACRDVFRKTALLGRLIPSIEEMLAAGEIVPPEAPPEAQGPAFPDPEPMGDAGHRG